MLLLIFGLTLSMAILVLGGTLVSVLMNKAGWLVYLGAAVLVVLAGEMIASDPWLIDNGLLPEAGWTSWVLTAAGAVVVLGSVLLRRKRRLSNAHVG
jgi:predicted tellurium resistance membrane protein TerC